jgi:hypothetical protein
VSKRSEFLLVLQTLVIVESQTRADAFGVYRASVVMEDALRVDERSIPDDVGKAASDFFTAIVLAASNPIGHERNSRFLVC